MESSSATTEKTLATDNFPPNMEAAADGGKEITNTNGQMTSIHDSEVFQDEYPHGFRLAVLVGAVCMTVFLTSLDQVSQTLATGTP
jgi:hypothetical protein